MIVNIRLENTCLASLMIAQCFWLLFNKLLKALYEKKFINDGWDEMTPSWSRHGHENMVMWSRSWQIVVDQQKVGPQNYDWLHRYYRRENTLIN